MEALKLDIYRFFFFVKVSRNKCFLTHQSTQEIFNISE